MRTELENDREGEMKDGKKHGRGKMNFSNGDSYTGMWVNDVKTGQGVYNFASGSRYQWRCSYITHQPILNL
jgi:hypothetical protein